MWLCGIWQMEQLHSRREPAFDWRLTRRISKRIWSYWPQASAQTQVKKGQNLYLPFCLQLLQHRIYKQIFWLGKTSYGGWIRMSCQIPNEILETYSLQESTFLWSKFSFNLQRRLHVLFTISLKISSNFRYSIWLLIFKCHNPRRVSILRNKLFGLP